MFAILLCDAWAVWPNGPLGAALVLRCMQRKMLQLAHEALAKRKSDRAGAEADTLLSPSWSLMTQSGFGKSKPLLRLGDLRAHTHARMCKALTLTCLISKTVRNPLMYLQKLCFIIIPSLVPTDACRCHFIATASAVLQSLNLWISVD